MTCTVLTAEAFARDSAAMHWIAGRLSREGSEWHRKILGWIAGFEPSAEDGSIAIVRDAGEIVGWARTEKWEAFSTLEAFVMPQYRRRGVAAFASTGLLVAGRLPPTHRVAVFTSPAMVSVARRVGLFPTLFVRSGEGWVRA